MEGKDKQDLITKDFEPVYLYIFGAYTCGAGKLQDYTTGFLII